MKTQIIQLNKNDDYISVRDKMNWSQTGRILLVWPKGGHILNRRLELNLLKRHANRLGAQLAIVTRESEIRFIAHQIGIPVFDNPLRAQEIHWRVGMRRNIDLRHVNNHPNLEAIRTTIHTHVPEWLGHPVTRIICFGISVLALIALGIFILPSATIMLAPQWKTQSMILSISADPSLKVANLSLGSLPTYSQEVIVEGSETIQVSGSVMIPDQVAYGGLRFTNISDHKVTIPTGMIVSTLGTDVIRFMISSTNGIVVDPRKSVILNAQAIVTGTSGNLPEDSLVAIESELGLDLTVTNPYATHGGTDASVPSPTIQDLTSIHERLVDKLEQVALSELQSLIPSEDTLIRPTLKIQEIIEETNSPAVGEPGRQLSISLRLQFQSQVISAEVLRSMVTTILDANTISGYVPVPSTLVLTRLTEPRLSEDGNAHWTLQLERIVQNDIPANQVIDLVMGLSVPQAIELLQNSLPLEEQAQITLTPHWWPRLPYLPMRIQVIQPET